MKSLELNYVPLSDHKKKIMILSQKYNTTNNNKRQQTKKHRVLDTHRVNMKKGDIFNIVADLICVRVSGTVLMENITTTEIPTTGILKWFPIILNSVNCV